MDFEKYTERARGFVQAAQNVALREGHQRFSPEHLLKVLLDDPEGLASGLIRSAGGDPKVALAQVEAALRKHPNVEGAGAGQIYLAPETARVFDAAGKLATKADDSFVPAERLLQAIATEPSEAQKALKSTGVTPKALEDAIAALRKGRTADTASPGCGMAQVPCGSGAAGAGTRGRGTKSARHRPLSVASTACHCLRSSAS